MCTSEGLFGLLIVVVLFANGQEEVLLEGIVGVDNKQGQLAVELIGLEVGWTLIATTFINHLVKVSTDDKGQRIVQVHSGTDPTVH